MFVAQRLIRLQWHEVKYGLIFFFSLIPAHGLAVRHNYSVYLFILILTSGQSNIRPETLLSLFSGALFISS